LVVLACVIAATVGAAGTARAGTYVMRTCNVPGALRSTVGPWEFFVGGGTFANDECAVGGGFGFNAGTIASASPASVTLGTAQGIAIRRVRLWLVARLAGTGSTLSVATQYGDGVSSPPAAVGLFGPPGGETLTTPYSSPELPANTRVFGVYVICGIEAGPCNPSSLNVLDIRGAEVTLEESTVPKASISGGELLTDGSQSGIRALAYSATDTQAGIARVSALIGKTIAGTSDFASECTYSAIAACPQTLTTTMAVDTRKVPDGIYPVSLVVTDAAGNEQTVQGATAIRVDNGAGALQSSSGALVADARLTALFASNRRSTLTVGYGRRVVVRGRLRGPDNLPIGGARLDIEERPASRNSAAAHRFATTGADGIFAYTVGTGPSRVLTLRYAGAPPATKEVRLRVKASAAFHVALKGIAVRYRGRVLSTPVPRTGKVVEIQGRAPGAGWKTFARRRTNRRGAFVGTYRLRIRRPGVRLQFRVRVPSERGYPFVAHAGPALTRIVH
jgi:hypothetical protein